MRVLVTGVSVRVGGAGTKSAGKKFAEISYVEALPEKEGGFVGLRVNSCGCVAEVAEELARAVAIGPVYCSIEAKVRKWRGVDGEQMREEVFTFDPDSVVLVDDLVITAGGIRPRVKKEAASSARPGPAVARTA